ncbi:MAG: hypothetical protein AD742_17910 [Methylibium sp. NZG]|nr:MAG: hypothetical protein AD742_17910 [Methylibium sp. NZG]
MRRACGAGRPQELPRRAALRDRRQRRVRARAGRCGRAGRPGEPRRCAGQRPGAGADRRGHRLGVAAPLRPWGLSRWRRSVGAARCASAGPRRCGRRLAKYRTLCGVSAWAAPRCVTTERCAAYR